MVDKAPGDDALDALFQAERARSISPTPDFMARLEADADASLPRPVPLARPAPRRTNWLAGLFTASGLSGATVAGLWIGFAMPDSLETFSLATESSVELTAFLPGADMGSLFDE